jgi:hypothetical protein
MSDVGGSVFIATLAFVAGALIILMTQGNPSYLDPTAAYCRGYGDGIVYAISQTQGALPTPEQHDQIEAGCELQTSADSAPAYARGPLHPE